MYKQIIIARKDLQMSPGKLAAQVSHGSIAWLTAQMRRNAPETPQADGMYLIPMVISEGVFREWILGTFTKCILGAKNKNQLLKARAHALAMGLKEDVDFFCIYDNCYTELTPEEENGTTLTCIGFAPLDNEVIDQIGKRYQLYK